MTEKQQKAILILNKISPANNITQDDIIYLKGFFNNDLSETPLIEKPIENLPSPKDPLPNENLNLEDVSHENSENANHTNETTHSENAQDDPETISNAKYNVLITLPTIILFFEDILTTFLLSKFLNAYLIAYVLIFSALHGIFTYALLYCKDKKRRRSLLGALFSCFISIGNITGRILGLVFIKKNDDKNNNDDIKRSGIQCVTLLIFYALITVPIYIYQTNCCRNKENIRVYN